VIDYLTVIVIAQTVLEVLIDYLTVVVIDSLKIIGVKIVATRGIVEVVVIPTYHMGTLGDKVMVINLIADPHLPHSLAITNARRPEEILFRTPILRPPTLVRRVNG